MIAHRYTLDTSTMQAVEEGLSKNPKTLPSWLFYDEQGNKLFQSIMHMPEYYPTRCEYEIIQNYKDALLTYFSFDDDEFQLIELGVGDGIKTEVLLEYFIGENIHFNYVPVDVSPQIITQLTTRLHRKLPELEINPQQARYEEALNLLQRNSHRKIILFLGANIGNYTMDEAAIFLKNVTERMSANDLLFVGFDMKKDPRTIQVAYDDPRGITRAFNLNLLKRINLELGADFHPERFSHFPTYDPVTGIAKSFLVSAGNQEVYIDALHKTFRFTKWETIQTEVSQKYDMPMITRMASHAGLAVAEVFCDSKKYFCDVLFKKV